MSALAATPATADDDLWRPRSTCDSACLTPAGPAAGAMLAGARLVALLGVLLFAVPAIAVVHVFGAWRGGGTAERVFAARVARALLRSIGVRHARSGRLLGGRALVVANHVSWLDILVLLAHTPARLVAKHQVRDWPLVGWLAAALGTVFVDRTRPRALPETVRQVRAHLARGGLVVVFPEGTTGCGRAVGAFRPAMFAAAVEAGAPVVPVRLTYHLGGAPTTRAAFLGEESLISSVWRVLAARELSARLLAYPALYPGAVPQVERHPSARMRRRRMLARAAQHMITCDGSDAGSARPPGPPVPADAY